ncbi:kinase-like protein [Epithele typhae]|uniref:kinase-like protein n=1 Tax=Epithele typhae TaxID=378194 RepID=UPI0020079E9E|nr:kinase-like protein [Epithele typhae]KAH9944190.1 kinase-like protein [Epithele typhae]
MPSLSCSPTITSKTRLSVSGNHPSAHLSSFCAKFITSTNTGHSEVLLLSTDKPLTIGRGPTCSYVITEPVVSGLHCKLYAVTSSNGGVIVSCQDLSTNGIVLNGHRIRKASVILMDGDILQIPSSQKFECVLLEREPKFRIHPFDPTPTKTGSPLKTKDIGRYALTSHCLGSGSFATVHLAMDSTANRQVACKCIKRKGNDKIDKVKKEVDILAHLVHPNINAVCASISDESFLYIFLELCTGGDLFSYITSKPQSQLCEGEAKYIMYQLLKGLKYLHDRMISHRGDSPQPENILLYFPGPYPRIQIADFGLARPRGYQETFNVCGTVSYLPPEGILALDNREMGYISMPADCWSSGVIMGIHPFDYAKSPDESQQYSYEASAEPYDEKRPQDGSGRSDALVKQRIIHGSLHFPRQPWDSVPHARDLCSDLLVYEPDDRITVQGALKSLWFTGELPDLETVYRARIGFV